MDVKGLQAVHVAVTAYHAFADDRTGDDADFAFSVPIRLTHPTPRGDVVRHSSSLLRMQTMSDLRMRPEFPRCELTHFSVTFLTVPTW